jgi:DNA-binding Lrp family transcriptional regulator
MPASQDSVVNGSKNGSGYRTATSGVTTTWSDIMRRPKRLLAERREILECLRTTGDDCYTLKVAATSMEHLETLVDELAGFGSTTTSVVYSQPLPYRRPDRP